MRLFTSFKNWFNKPYFFIQSKRARLLIAFVIAFVIFFNITVIRPHGVSKLQNNLISFAFGYALIIFSVISVYFFGARNFFPSFFEEEKWTIKKEVTSVFFVLCIMAVCGWLYTNMVQIGVKDPSKISLPAFFKYTFLGIFPLVTYVFLSEFLLNKFREKNVKSIRLQLRKRLKKKRTLDKVVKIYATNQQEVIECNLLDLVYIKSEGNYASIFINDKEGNLNEKAIRCRLNSLEELFKKYDEIFRCHKSYIINTKFVNDISGNARGYYLHLTSFKAKIPVSRKISKEKLMRFL